MKAFFLTYWPGMLALLLAALYVKWRPSETNDPDEWIDPEKERSAHLLGKHR